MTFILHRPVPSPILHQANTVIYEVASETLDIYIRFNIALQLKHQLVKTACAVPMHISCMHNVYIISFHAKFVVLNTVDKGHIN